MPNLGAKSVLTQTFARLKAGKRTPLTSVLRPTEEPERERGTSAPVLNRGVEMRAPGMKKVVGHLVGIAGMYCILRGAGLHDFEDIISWPFAWILGGLLLTRLGDDILTTARRFNMWVWDLDEQRSALNRMSQRHREHDNRSEAP